MSLSREMERDSIGGRAMGLSKKFGCRGVEYWEERSRRENGQEKTGC
jgi:hypothetical protein